MSQPNPEESTRRVDPAVQDQPPGYSAPFTRRQWLSLIIPVAVFLVIAAVLITGLSLSGASGRVATPTATSAEPSATSVAVVAVNSPTDVASPTAAPATATPSSVPSPTNAPAVAPTNTTRPAATSSPTIEATAEPRASSTAVAGADKPLLGRRVALDPGHGPREDLGAVYVDPDLNQIVLSERQVNLDVAKRVRDILVARGAVVSMTREVTDTFTLPWPPDTNGDGIEGGQADDLQQRIDIINASEAEVFLSIHMNSHADPEKRQGIQAVYCAAEECDFPEENKSFGIDVLDQLELHLAEIGYPVQARELRSDKWAEEPNGPEYHLFLLGPADSPNHPRAVQMPGVIIEALYITSPVEVEQLKLDNVRQAIAEAYADAVTIYLTRDE